MRAIQITAQRGIMEQKLAWNECQKCFCILDEDIPRCPSPCESEDFKAMCLTPTEVMKRVWPNIGKIWTKHEPKFSGLPRRWLLYQKLEQALLKRAQKLAIDASEPCREAVSV